MGYRNYGGWDFFELCGVDSKGAREIAFFQTAVSMRLNANRPTVEYRVKEA